MNVCPGCNVRGLWEHRCCAPDMACECMEPECRERQGHEVDWTAMLDGDA